MADAVQDLRALLLITFRPEYECRWSGYAHATTLALNRLTRSQTESMILHVADDHALPAEVVEQIVAKTDGIPLFVEELTKNVLESGLVNRVADHYELSGPLVPLAIPTSLQDSLMARLDRLAPIKEVAQIGAAIGREFPYALLARIAGREETELRAALEQLTDAELIYRRGTPPNSTYVFKHALVQDAAYASLLKSRRQQLHADIATALLEMHHGLVETQPELLAHHFEQAGLAEAALEYWQAAANRAISRSAYSEALNQLDHALAQLALLPAGEARDRRELELQVTKLGPLFPIKGYASREADETSARALVLSRTVGDHRTVFPTLYARWAYRYVTSNQKEMFDLSREYLERATAEADDAACIVGNRIHAVALFYRGEIEAAREHARRALQRYDPDRHIPLVARFGQDLKVTALNYAAVSDALLGNIDDASAFGLESIAHARKLNHANTLAYALWHVGIWLPAMLRDAEALNLYGAEMLELSRVHRLKFWEDMGMLHVAINGFGKSRAEAAADAEAALDTWRHEHNGAMLLPEILCRIGDAYLDENDCSQARRVLGEAATIIENDGERYWESELYRVRGRLAAMDEGESSPAAIAEYQRAIAIARERNTRLLELRAATGLAALLVARGERGAAKQLLSPVYDWFSGGYDKPDLMDAKAVLDGLA